ncbi:hypothetical protein BDV97DRAFT_371923 [Delphinella strobiligena]|nr:hypothetical protein BDV97DRAFT_371923 [Delphinella strobiligena]
MSTQNQDGFFTNYDEGYWNKYLAARPVYSQDFYSLIYEHHIQFGGSGYKWTNVADVGTGPGNVVAELAQYFDNIFASDASKEHIIAAQHRLAHLPANKVTFATCRCEDLIDGVDGDCARSATFDMVTAAEYLLRPGGTCAIWLYGRPIFTTSDRCQELYDRIANNIFSRVRPMKGTDWERGYNTMASFLDNVALPSAQWSHVKRYKWNADKPMAFLEQEACDFEPMLSSAISPDEQVYKLTDREWWASSWTMSEVKRFLSVLVPGFERDEGDSDMEGLWIELEKAMGGKDAVHRITWPMVLILGTRL